MIIVIIQQYFKMISKLSKILTIHEDQGSHQRSPSLAYQHTK